MASLMVLFHYTVGYDVGAISCVDPEEYASRILEFNDEHVS